MSELDLVTRATALAESIRGQSHLAEQQRHLPQHISSELAKAGFFRLFVEARHGGLEASPATAARVFEALAESDSAAAWVAFIGATSGTLLARLPDTAISEILTTPTTLIVGVVAAHGRAEIVPDGFIVNGRWPWGSGSPNADWITGGCLLTERGEILRAASGAPRSHMLFFPRGSVTLHDTWQVSGLRGTGSGDFEVRDLFVPARHASGFIVRQMPERPLFQFPQNALLASGIAAVALGIARDAIAELVTLAKGKRRAGSTNTIATRTHAHLEVATAEARLRAARAFFYEALMDTWQSVSTGNPATVAQRRDLRLSISYAVQAATQVVDAMYTLAGGSAIYESSRLQRHLRDIHVVTQHIMVGAHTYETVGRLLLGVDVDLTSF